MSNSYGDALTTITIGGMTLTGTSAGHVAPFTNSYHPQVVTSPGMVPFTNTPADFYEPQPGMFEPAEPFGDSEYSELEQIVAQLEVLELRARVAELERQIAELTAPGMDAATRSRGIKLRH